MPVQMLWATIKARGLFVATLAPAAPMVNCDAEMKVGGGRVGGSLRASLPVALPLSPPTYPFLPPLPPVPPLDPLPGQAVFGADAVELTRLQERLKVHLSTPPPLTFQYTVR